MRIIAGRLRGTALVAPAGAGTRPTAERVRQALFDTLAHAAWGGRALFEGVAVLDGFAGTGALGLEALSRGAARASFIESDRGALAALRANVARCRADATVIAADACHPPPGTPCGLVFLDPPYGRALVSQALTALEHAGWLAPGAVLVSETAADEPLALAGTLLDDRRHGAARVRIWRLDGAPEVPPASSTKP